MCIGIPFNNLFWLSLVLVRGDEVHLRIQIQLACCWLTGFHVADRWGSFRLGIILIISFVQDGLVASSRSASHEWWVRVNPETKTHTEDNILNQMNDRRVSCLML